MSQTTTCSLAQSKQLHLFNIITLAEDKLHANFNRILYRLNYHQKQIQQNKTSFQLLTQRLNNIAYNLQLKINTQIQNSNNLIKAGNAQIQKLNYSHKGVSQKLQACQKTLLNLGKSHQKLRSFIDVQSEARNLQYQSTKQKIRNIQLQLVKIDDNFDKKQNISQVNKLKQCISSFQYQLGKLAQQQKFVQFKLDKFQINNQKSQKNQMNKQLSFMRQIEQKLKAELKNCISQIQKVANNSITQKSISSNLINRPSQSESFSAFKQQEKQNIISQSNNQLSQKASNKLYQSVNNMQRKFQIYDKQLKQLTQLFQSLIKNKKSNGASFQEKLNAIKPEFIKLWAKSDALQDKNSFIQRRLQQKNKQISYILQVLKQTQSSKFQEKLKIFQTQVFCKLQQQRAKIQSKVNLIEFEKFSKSITEKVQSLNEQVVLKCDKLQVKKALLFLESKIKEIILVISQQQQNEKDALLTKKQVKCISCDKEIDKFSGVASNLKGNWDAFPNKQHCPEVLGRFGMTSFGSLSRKLRRIQSKDIQNIANRKSKQSAHSDTRPNS